MSEPYEIRYADEAVSDIRMLRAFDQRRILEAIERHLTYEPERVSRSRIKALLQPFWSQYRLRVDEFRVCYDVDDELHVVYVLRVLMKTTHRTPEQSP